MKKLTTAMIALLLSCSIIFSGCEDTSSSKSKKHKKKDKKEKIEEVEPEEETDETDEPEESDEPDETEESEVIEETEASADYEVLYAPIIEEYISLMDDFDSDTYWDTVDYKEGYSWLPESCFYSGADYVSENYGFAYVDLNDDEIMELLIVESLINDYDNEGSYVNAIFTLYEGEPAFVMEGYYRSAYYLSGDNKLAYFGSGGWAYTSFGQFSYDEDFDMIWDNYYFSDLDSDGETVIYYAQTDNNDDMRYEIDEDTFEQEYDNLAYNTTSIEFTSFAQYAEDNNIDAYFPPVPLSTYAYEIDEEDLDYYDTINVVPGTDSSYISYVNVYANSDVDNIILNKLEFEGLDSNDQFIFTEEPVIELGKVPMYIDNVFALTFMGDMPTYGITVERGDEVRKYYFEVSGEDGSIYLNEYN